MVKDAIAFYTWKKLFSTRWILSSSSNLLLGTLNNTGVLKGGCTHYIKIPNVGSKQAAVKFLKSSVQKLRKKKLMKTL